MGCLKVRFLENFKTVPKIYLWWSPYVTYVCQHVRSLAITFEERNTKLYMG